MYKKCPVCNEEKKIQYFKNREQYLSKVKKYAQENTEKVAAYQKSYQEKNKKLLSASSLSRKKKRYKEDEVFAIKEKLRSRLGAACRDYSTTGKTKPSGEFINYEGVINHLGPCPGDRADYHIDHIRPLCSFDFNDEDQIREAFAPENHQWLLAKDNLKKGGKY